MINRGSIRESMYEKGWISKQLFEKGGIPIDLYYCWINNVQLNTSDENYIKDGYFDNCTISSQLDAYVEEYHHIKNCTYANKEGMDFIVGQVQLLKAIFTIKIEQSN